MFVQQSLQPKLSRRCYVSVSYALQNNTVSRVHRTESVSVMGHELTMGVSSTRCDQKFQRRGYMVCSEAPGAGGIAARNTADEISACRRIMVG